MVQLVVAWPLILPSPTDLIVVYYLVVVVESSAATAATTAPTDTVVNSVIREGLGGVNSVVREGLGGNTSSSASSNGTTPCATCITNKSAADRLFFHQPILWCIACRVPEAFVYANASITGILWTMHWNRRKGESS